MSIHISKKLARYGLEWFIGSQTWRTSGSPGGIVRIYIPEPCRHSSGSVGLEWSHRLCVSTKILGNANAAVLVTTLLRATGLFHWHLFCHLGNQKYSWFISLWLLSLALVMWHFYFAFRFSLFISFSVYEFCFQISRNSLRTINIYTST